MRAPAHACHDWPSRLTVAVMQFEVFLIYIKSQIGAESRSVLDDMSLISHTEKEEGKN